VQGDGAAAEIVQGLRALNRIPELDVLILARGGGSLEDLWPFNDEMVARAMSVSRIPTLSAVGHETDYTIADFVADLRAPTPSAAAETVVRAKAELEARVATLEKHLASAIDLRLTRVRARVAAVTSHRVFEAERGRIRSQLLRTVDLQRRAEAGLRQRLERSRERVRRAAGRVEDLRWDRQLAVRRDILARHQERLATLFRGGLESRRAALGRLAAKLEGLSPLAVLSRGYALVWDPARRRFVRAPTEVEIGDALRIRVQGGGLEATVTGKESE